MGSVGETTYSVPREADKLLDEVLNNPLIPSLPSGIKDAGRLVHLSGLCLPSIPINWRFAESVSALKAFEASMLIVLRSKKYNVPISEVSINIDHALLFVMSPFLTKIVGSDGKEMEVNVFDGPAQLLCMNPDPTLMALQAPPNGKEGDTCDSVADRFQKVVEQTDSHDLDLLMNEQYKQANTIAWTTKEFLESEHGKANAHVGLYSLSKIEGQTQPAAWWPDQDSMT